MTTRARRTSWGWVWEVPPRLSHGLRRIERQRRGEERRGEERRGEEEVVVVVVVGRRSGSREEAL
eukprot:765307-Hanusia_phi.AAC.5